MLGGLSLLVNRPVLQFFLREVNFKNQRSFFRYFAFEEDVFVAESQFLLLTESQFIGVTRFGFLF